MNPAIKRRMEHNARMAQMMAEREVEVKALREFQNSPQAHERDRQAISFLQEAMVDLIVDLKGK